MSDKREKSERFRRGREALQAIMGEGQIARLDAAYAEVAPDMTIYSATRVVV